MQLIEIMPDKKYVVVMPTANRATALKLQQQLRELLEGEGGGVLLIGGIEVAIVPADQVLGYTALGSEQPEEA